MCHFDSSTVNVEPDTEESAKSVEGADGSKQRREPGPDGGESVRLALILVFISFLTSAGFRSAGFLYIGIMSTYGVSREEASWPLSVIGAVTNLAGVIAGPLAQRYPTRPIILMGAISAAVGMISSFWADFVLQLTISLGVFYGFGCGVIFTMINITLTQYFDKYRAVAFGIVYAGSTMASFVFPKLLLTLDSIFAFKGVLLLFGGIISNLVALSLYVKEPSWIRSKTSTLAPSNKASLRESFTVLKQPIFHVCLITNILFQYGFDAFMTTLVDFAVDRGATLQEAVNLFPWFAVADVIGRGVLPFTADRGIIERPKLITLCYLLTGVFTALIPISRSYLELVVCVLLMGTFCGCAAVLYGCIVADFIGPERLPLAFGVIGTVNGGFYFTKPFFLGHFRDVVKSYDGMFQITGGLTLFTGFMWVGVLLLTRRSKKIREKASLEESKTSNAVPVACSNMALSLEETQNDSSETVRATTFSELL